MPEMHEFYIREATEKEARGPFNLEQLISMAETGGLTVETLFYDAGTEQWVTIASVETVKVAVFPEKRKLTIKAKEIETLNKPESESSRAPITVDDMLAAAEGRTDDTKDRKDPAIAAGRAARIGMWAVVLMLVISAAGELLPASDAIIAVDMGKLIEHPVAILGVVDLVLAVTIGLGVVSLYPFIRFRAALGMGFFAFTFFVQGLSMPFAAIVVGSIGLYLSTVSVSLLVVGIAALAGLAGLGGAAYFLISS